MTTGGGDVDVLRAFAAVYWHPDAEKTTPAQRKKASDLMLYERLRN
jgi:hypothetical protein